LKTERRGAARIVEFLSFRIGHQRYEIQSTTINLSSNGALCLVDRDIPVMTRLAVSLSLPASGASQPAQDIAATGVVVRTEKRPDSGKFCVAIYFSKIGPKARKVLRGFIASRLKKNTG